MQNLIIDEAQLNQDINYRAKHFCEFIGYTDADKAWIERTARAFTSQAEALVDGVYEFLFKWSSTASYFVAEDGIIRDAFMNKRKQSLTEWLLRIASGSCDGELASYLSHVGQAHRKDTGTVRKDVPHLYLLALTSVLQTTISNALATHLSNPQELAAAISAWNKVLMFNLQFMMDGQQQAPAKA